MKAFQEKILSHDQKSLYAFQRNAANYDFSWHIHAEYEIVYILEGFGVRYIGNSVEQYNAPEIVFIPPDVPHTWCSAADSHTNVAYVVQFEENCLGRKWYELPEFNSLKPLLTSSTSVIVKNCTTLLNSFQKVCQTQNLPRVSAFIELLDQINKANKRPLGSLHILESNLLNSRIDKILAWIHQHYTKEFTLEKLADDMSMSSYQLRTLFKKHIHKSVIQYTKELRVFEACKLMRNVDYSISHISALCGFNNLSYFNRTFRHITGMTPREYRQSFV
jgi:AraC-like DNA-binding protein